MSTKLKLRVETVSERVLRQVRTGKLDEARLLPAADKRTRDVNKRLDKLASRQGWYVFVSVRGRSGVCDGDRQGSLRRSPAGAETSSSSRWTGSRSSTGGTTPTARVEACPDVAMMAAVARACIPTAWSRSSACYSTIAQNITQARRLPCAPSGSLTTTPPMYNSRVELEVAFCVRGVAPHSRGNFRC